MRIHLTLTKNRSIIPYDYLPMLVGTLHKWLGQNEWHDQLALHSFSWLKGTTKGSNGFFIERDAHWFISSYNTAFIKRVIAGIQSDPSVSFGIEVRSITIQEDPTFTTEHTFTVASPVFIKRRIEERIRHYTFSDKESSEFLTETLITKLTKAGLESDGVKVSFDQTYPLAKTKLVKYNGIGNRASICPVIVKGSPEQIAFAWNVGVGNSTGIGFGALN